MVRKGTEGPAGAGIPAGPAGPLQGQHRNDRKLCGAQGGEPIMVSGFPRSRAATAAAQQITAKVTFFIQQFM